MICVEAMMDRDAWIRAYRNNAASWPALLVVYAILVGAMVLSGMAIT